MTTNTRANCCHNDLIPLSSVPRAIQALTGEPGPPYRHAYFAALDGRIPAEQVRGRWFVRQADLPAVAHAWAQCRPTLSPR